MGCSAIQNPWFRKSRIRRGVMGKRANKRVTFTAIIERVNSPCQLLNLLGTEALYEVSIGLVTGAFFTRHDFFYLGDRMERLSGHQDRCSDTILRSGF